MAAIVPVFEKSCRYIASHSQPIETQGIRPTLDKLRPTTMRSCRPVGPTRNRSNPRPPAGTEYGELALAAPSNQSFSLGLNVLPASENHGSF
jgi:hypothetical protein